MILPHRHPLSSKKARLKLNEEKYSLPARLVATKVLLNNIILMHLLPPMDIESPGGLLLPSMSLTD